LYADYNQVTLKGIGKGLIMSVWAFNTSFVSVIDLSLYSLPFVFLIAGGAILFFALRQKILSEEQNKTNFWLLVFGVLAFFLAVFPYTAVGKMPYLGDWESRHQLLVPLGAGFILFYGFKLLLNKLKANSRMQVFVYSVIIVSFISTNIKTYIEYKKDWYKQLALIENFKSEEIIKNNTSFLFEDKTFELNAKGRIYRFYEYTGLMKLALGDQIRFADNANTFKNLEDYKPYLNARYNVADFNPIPPQYIVYINYGTLDLNSKKAFLRLLYDEFFNYERFNVRIKDAIRLEFKKLPQGN
jgi:hypothetical protein